MNDDHHRFATLLHRAAAQWRTRLDERLRPWGLSQATWRTLWALRQEGEHYDQKRLAERLGIETPTLVGLLDRMEARSLLRREPDPADRRRKFVAITDAGNRIADEIESVVIAMRAEMLAGVSPEDLAVGIRLCGRMLENAANSEAA